MTGIVLTNLGESVKVRGGNPQFMDSTLRKNAVTQVSRRHDDDNDYVLIFMADSRKHIISHEYFDASYKSDNGISDNGSLLEHLENLFIL